MTIELGRVRELYRYPVKSMVATPIESGQLGWHGLDGDRRFAFRRLADHSEFPGSPQERLSRHDFVDEPEFQCLSSAQCLSR